MASAGGQICKWFGRTPYAGAAIPQFLRSIAWDLRMAASVAPWFESHQQGSMYLKWDAAQHGGVTVRAVPSSQLWQINIETNYNIFAAILHQCWLNMNTFSARGWQLCMLLFLKGVGSTCLHRQMASWFGFFGWIFPVLPPHLCS